MFKSHSLCNSGKTVKIPTGLVLSDVRDHSLSPRIVESLKTNILHHHGLNAFYLDSRWIMVDGGLSPDVVLRNKFVPVEFDGSKEALHSAVTQTGAPHFEYLKFYGIYADLPFQQLVSVLKESYAQSDIKVLEP